MSEINYIIEKVVVEVNVPNMETANSIKNSFSSYLQEKVFPQLERLLGEYDQTGRVARIDSLNLKIATLRYDDFEAIETEIVNQFSNNLRALTGYPEKTSEAFLKPGVEIIPTEKSREDIFLFFLENGYLPWFGTENDITGFLKPENWQKSLSDRLFFDRLTKVLTHHKTAIERFFNQLDYKAVSTFIFKIKPLVKNTEKDILTLIQKLPRKSRQIFLRLLYFVSTGSETRVLVQTARQFSASFRSIIRHKNDGQSIALQSTLTGFFRKTELFTDDEKNVLTEIILTPFTVEQSQKSDSSETENEMLDEHLLEHEIEPASFFERQEGEIAVQNAGLILLHPFFKTFFKTVDFLNEKGQIKNSEFHVAVQTLHFLATGSHDFFEGNLVFEKFLCGVPLKMPVEKESLLSEKIEAESLQLLTEVIRHWPALKNTSPEGLRQMFFQRNGKLIQKDKNFRLIVERKAQDILLDKLNWNISLVKLPWSNELLYVEW